MTESLSEDGIRWRYSALRELPQESPVAEALYGAAETLNDIGNALMPMDGLGVPFEGAAFLLTKGAKALTPSSKVLGRVLESAGEVRQAGDAAHHIAAGKAVAAEPSRQLLKKSGIGINDRANGVFLQAETHYKTFNNQYHLSVYEALSGASTREEAIEALQSIGAGLKNGTFP